MTTSDAVDLTWISATDLAARVAEGSVSVRSVAEAVIDRVERINPALNAIVHFDAEQVRADAADLDRRREAGDDLGPLGGVPYTIKDLTAQKGRPLTFGMLPLKDQVADANAPIVERLAAAGGLFLGRTNTPESGYYGGTDNHLFGPTQNPWRAGYTPGGSSGGAAAAVAAGLGPLAEGSDGGGSVRVPAALCGVVGFKPSRGLVPQTIMPGRFYEWAHHGPITRTVADAALMLDVVSGADSRDPMSFPRTGASFGSAVRAATAEGLRVAYSPDLGFGHVDPEVAGICAAAVERLATAGATVTEATPAWGDPEEAMWNGVWLPAFASEHDLLDWRAARGTVDDELIDVILAGEHLTAVDIGRADVFQGAMWDTYAAFMHDYDVLISPTLATAAFPNDRFAPEWLDGEPLRRRLLGWLLTYPYNMLTAPALSVPAGFTAGGLPVGLQIAGGHHADAVVLAVGAVLEQVNPWLDSTPALAE
ncbi:amidase [Tsukamurella paurometabola]|uniref:amidase n=1 Tax=Tsukamurella paurometabola TaxID=2061 RepID=A0ABS5N5W5_TSUPA|nr:amidase family protein [Tsukamurella paurometabola]MBS4099665.1 amidase [Tsukamurella paurometabola]